MDILFVNACVREGSRTLALCREYIKKHYAEDHVQEVVLQNEGLLPFNGKMLAQREADIAARKLDAARYSYARAFAAADEIIIAAPYWDSSFPAALKTYIEHICVNGLTFAYSQSNEPLPMCRAKRLVYVVTAGGYLPSPCSLELYLKELCCMLCIPEIRFCKADGLDILGNDPAAILEQAALQL